MINKFTKISILLMLAAAFAISVSAQKKPARKVAPKPPVSKPVAQTIASHGSDTVTGTEYAMTIEHNDEKKEIASGQFEMRDGNTISAGENRLLLFYSGSNSKDEQRFSFNASIPAAKKGVFSITGEDQSPSFSITTSAFPKSGAFKAKSGNIEITAMPAGEGFVEGKFSGVCEVTNEFGATEIYHISGSFRLRKRIE